MRVAMTPWVRLFITVALILGAASVVEAHGTDEPTMDMDMGMTMSESYNVSESNPIDLLPTYWTWPEHRGLLYGHIILMVLAWVFILPVGVMLGVAHSMLHVPIQMVFIGTNVAGVVLALLYNASTPDLYENNAHHKIGWIIMAVLAAQLITGLIRVIVRLYKPKETVYEHMLSEDDHMASRGMSYDATPRNSGQYHDGRPHFKRSLSQASTLDQLGRQQEAGSSSSRSPMERENDMDDMERVGVRQPAVDVEKYVPRRLANLHLPQRVEKLGWIIHAVLGRPLILFGFVQLCTGVVTVTGMMLGSEVYNGLAHFIKGGIFLWYGVITLGRYFGAFADLGWAWNIKPANVHGWRAKVPTGEFVESFVIFLYGATQVWMEHLGNENGVWSPKDLQHVSIAIMMFFFGSMGMLIESKYIKGLFTRVVMQQVRDITPSGSTDAYLQPPIPHAFSYNPFPGIVIFLVGIMMSMHVQETMLATMVHKQWGYLLACFSLFRLLTYSIMFVSPPTSSLPAYPVSELLASFCLICGGIIFMASNSETVNAMNRIGVNAMFTFNLSVSAAVAIMTWITLCMALKAWATPRSSL